MDQLEFSKDVCGDLYLSEDASEDVLGHIFSDAPEVIGCFRSFSSVHRRSGDPAKADRTLACVPAALATLDLLSRSHLEAPSAASMADFMAVLLASPVTPSRVYKLIRERLAKPLHPTLIGSQQTLLPILQHCSTSSSYLARLRSLASSWIRSSQGTVCSMRSSCSEEVEESAMWVASLIQLWSSCLQQMWAVLLLS